VSRPATARLPAAPEWLFLRLGQQRFSTAWPEFLLQSLLPALSWRAHLVVADAVRPGQEAAWDRLVATATGHLDRYRFATLWLHPVVVVDRAAVDDPSWIDWMLAPARRFELEAYQEQAAPRLGVLPVLLVDQEAQETEWLRLAERLCDRLATPTVVVGEVASAAADAALARGMRLVVGLAAGADGAALLDRLWRHHVVDGGLERVAAAGGDPLAPCRRHLVVDPGRGGAFGCLRAWSTSRPVVPLDRDALDAPAVTAECAACTVETALAVAPDLEINRRRHEGRALLERLAVGSAARGDHRLAAEAARGAFGMASADRDRAVAGLLLGLALIECGELAAADAALVQAAECGADPGLVAYHRGRAELAWPDEIAALERFGEALVTGSPDVATAELHLEMAICHVRLAEYPEARQHLDAVDSPTLAPAVAFYNGLADLGEGAAERALARFDEALAAGPAAGDLERVLLYQATCLKELGRFGEAADRLERALVIEPDELALHNLLGYCRFKLGDHAGAAACFERAVALDEGSAIDWANLGVNLAALDRPTEAAAALRRALALDRSLGFAAAALARLDNAG
jgi:tetratricopeptide (TPR) repeat protein